MIDLSQIPTGTDGKPDPVMLNAVLSRQLEYIKQDLKRCRDGYQELYDTAQFNSVEVTRLRRREVKVLERWVRRRAITRQHTEIILLIAGAALVAVPLFIVACSLAWRLAVWSVAG